MLHEMIPAHTVTAMYKPLTRSGTDSQNKSHILYYTTNLTKSLYVKSFLLPLSHSEDTLSLQPAVPKPSSKSQYMSMAMVLV